MDNKRSFCAGIMWLCIAAGVGFSGCSKHNDQNENTRWNDAIRLEKAQGCYNTYLGIAFTVPKGWWILDLNTANFSPDPEDTAEKSTFDIIYKNDSTGMSLINFANLISRNRRKCIQYKISVDSRKNIPINEEFSDNLEGITENQEEIPIIDTSIITINSSVFDKNVYEASQPRNNYRIITLSARLKKGNFLHISAFYWPQNKNAESSIITLITRSLILE